MTDTNPRPWRERITFNGFGALLVDGVHPSVNTYDAAKRGVLDEAHAFAAEVERLRSLLATPADGPLRVERDTYSNAECPHRMYMGENFLCALFPAEADAIEAQLAARPATHDLPDGVQPWAAEPIEIDGVPVVGVALGDVVRGLSDDEWLRAYCDEGWCQGANADAGSGHTYLLGRKPQPTPPPTERVPLHQLKGRTLKGCTWPVGSFAQRADGAFVANPEPEGDPGFAMMTEAAIFVDADGTVEVLR